MKIKQKNISNHLELQSFQEALKSAGLPDQDLNYQKQILTSYYDEDELLGTGGLEVINQLGLLRSVSVSPNHRNKSIGKKITSDLLEKAIQNNIKTVYLLTETAKDYFQKLGFIEVSREAVPKEIKLTTEFASVCPTTATCMVLELK
jgi:amino-acid N-acetyltransferase